MQIGTFLPPRDRSLPQASVFLPALVILVGLGLRLVMLGNDARFHPDEALFAAQARLITTQSDWLLRTTDLDKPPLTFYFTALSFQLGGTGEFAARLPNALVSALTVAALYGLAFTLYHDRPTAALAAFLLALSPYDLAFAATVFTDVQATFWVVLAARYAARDQWGRAGAVAALIGAAKPNALLALPLILALGFAGQARQEWTARDLIARLWRFVWPLLLGIALLVLWDAARSPRSFWVLGWQRNDPGRFIRSGEVMPRLEEWTRIAAHMTGSRALNAMLLGLGIPWWIGRARSLHHQKRTASLDILIGTFVLAFIAWHWLVAFNTYDRYLHSLTPFALLLAARALVSVFRAVSAAIPILLLRARWTNLAAVAILLIALLPGTIAALRGDIHLGGDQGQHTGIDTLAEALNSFPQGTIVYDHWLGWELAYYLGSNPTPQVRYTPQPEALVDDLVTTPGKHLFVAPSPQKAALWLSVLGRASIRSETIYHNSAQGFVIYRLK